MNERDRLVEYWLTNDEKSDPALRELMKPEFKRWKVKKYQPVVYESGAGDLRDSVLGLMQKSLRDQAKREAEEEKRLLEKAPI